MGYCLAGFFLRGRYGVLGGSRCLLPVPASALVLFISLLSFSVSIVFSLSCSVFALRSIPGCFLFFASLCLRAVGVGWALL